MEYFFPKENSLVPIPEPQFPSPHVDPLITEQWLLSEKNGSLRSIKEKLVGAITNISFPQFKEDLRVVSSQLGQVLGSSKSISLWDTKSHKSGRWVESLALSTLQGASPVASAYANIEPRKILQMLQATNVNTIVAFSDAIYSGEQLYDNVYSPLDLLLREVHYPDQIRMFFVAPYATESFQKDIVTRTSSHSPLYLQALVAQTMPEIADILTEEEQEILSQHDYHLNDPSAVREENAKYRPVLPGLAKLFGEDIRYHPIDITTVVTTFDHKIADELSVCRPLLASVGIDVSLPREPYKLPGTQYYELEEREFTS